MGYYTKHKLQVYNEDLTPILLKDLNFHRRKIAYSTIYGLDLWDDTQKWYESDKDMKNYSKKYPNLIFVLTGYGEEQLDIWRTYYKNGKGQNERAVIQFPTYNPHLLTD